MTAARIAPYGSWTTPITADLIIRGAVGLNAVRLDADDIYWTEGRPSEACRAVIVRRTSGGRTEDVTPPGFNVRNRVHEYGGGAFVVDGGTVYFSNFDDNRLYRQGPGAEPQTITPEARLRYADMVVDRTRARLICVREDHRQAGEEAINTVVAVDLDGDGQQVVLISGNDFYASPRLSPDGCHLAWLTWNHPNMPWDGNELWIGTVVDDGSIVERRRVAGGNDVSIFQPEWSPDGALHYVSDATGWWNLYRWTGRAEEPLCPMEAEFGAPQWVFGLSTYGFLDSVRLVCAYSRDGQDHLALLDTTTAQLQPIDLGYHTVRSIRATSGYAVFIAGSPTEPEAVVRLDLASRQSCVLKRSAEISIDTRFVSVPAPIAFPSENGRIAHAFLYLPVNPDFKAPPGELPPLIVRSHGGPTGQALDTLDLTVQYWTSRGFAFLDVNYGGSSGFGRAYRQLLNGQWGVVDVDDCMNAAHHVAGRGTVDPNRLIIVGGSAGGYTTLCALTFRDAFHAGASYFGLADLEPFVADTHKFESRYLERLIGPYPARRDLYRARSPIHFTDRLSVPVILFQGLDDKIVPPRQAEVMVDALRRKGIPFAYVAFEGEGHGFRRGESIKRTLDGELYFYSRIFDFPVPDSIEPIEIENLSAASNRSC